MQVAFTPRKALRAPQRGLLLIGGGRWTDPLKMAKNRPKMGASAPSFRDTPSKNFLGFFQPIWVGEKNWPFFRQTNQKNRKTPSGRFFVRTVFCLRKISCFWVPSGRFFENFQFFFLGPKWVWGWFGGVLGSFWVLFLLIGDLNSHAGGLHNPEGQVSDSSETLLIAGWTDGRTDAPPNFDSKRS